MEKQPPIAISLSIRCISSIYMILTRVRNDLDAELARSPASRSERFTWKLTKSYKRGSGLSRKRKERDELIEKISSFIAGTASRAYD